MVVEILQVAEQRHGAGGMAVQRWRAMTGQIDVVGLAERPGGQEAGDAAAAGGIGLLHVHRAGFQHPADIVER